ncbi:MAG: DUF4118 domain-containing protein [Planctomycetes bacterium]|nr:DUF4118 domain-containing protein [Planctomycetota bacterium]
MNRTVPHRPIRREVAEMLAIVAGAVGLAALTHAPGSLATEAMVLVLGIVVVALRCRRILATAAVLVSSLAFNVLFTEPRWSLTIADRNALAAFVVMLVLGLLMSTLVERLRASSAAAHSRAEELASLNQLARALAVADDERAVAQALLDHLVGVVDAPLVLLFAGQGSSSRPSAAVVVGDDWLGEAGRHALIARMDGGTVPGTPGPVASAPIGLAEVSVGLLAWRSDAADASTALAGRLSTALTQAATAIERLRAQTAERQLHEAAAKERLRSTLLASVSHDLRTPLASITGAASSLLDDGADLPPAERTALLAGIVQESQRLNELIANLLFATRLDAGDVVLRAEWTSLEEIVGAAVRRARTQSRSGRIQVVPAALPLLQADPVLLEQCVFLLLDNAVRHAPQEAHVEVRPFVADGRVGVDVHDDGPGVPPELRARLFQRFERGPRSSGLGLGLAIAAAIARAHGGSLRLHDVEQPGATFRLELPVPVQPGDVAGHEADPSGGEP